MVCSSAAIVRSDAEHLACRQLAAAVWNFCEVHTHAMSVLKIEVLVHMITDMSVHHQT